jgi:hypothetical protein
MWYMRTDMTKLKDSLSRLKRTNLKTELNLLKPSGNFTYYQVQHSKILRGAHIAFICFVRISEQTATFALQNIKRLVFITEAESVYSAVRPESLYKTDMFHP